MAEPATEPVRGVAVECAAPVVCKEVALRLPGRCGLSANRASGAWESGPRREISRWHGWSLCVSSRSLAVKKEARRPINACRRRARFGQGARRAQEGDISMEHDMDRRERRGVDSRASEEGLRGIGRGPMERPELETPPEPGGRRAPVRPAHAAADALAQVYAYESESTYAYEPSDAVSAYRRERAAAGGASAHERADAAAAYARERRGDGSAYECGPADAAAAQGRGRGGAASAPAASPEAAGPGAEREPAGSGRYGGGAGDEVPGPMQVHVHMGQAEPPRAERYEGPGAGGGAGRSSIGWIGLIVAVALVLVVYFGLAGLTREAAGINGSIREQTAAMQEQTGVLQSIRDSLWQLVESVKEAAARWLG